MEGLLTCQHPAFILIQILLGERQNVSNKG
jgi:hypothetical protein